MGFSSLPRIRGTQIGLRDPALVDTIKEAMLAGEYAYRETRGMIAGVRDPFGVYHVIEGHHRMVAALEIFREHDDDRCVRLLLEHGRWPDITYVPSDSRPMPSRYWLGRLQNRLGFGLGWIR